MNFIKQLWNKLTMKPTEPELSDYQKEKQAVWDKHEADLAREYNGQRKIRKPVHGSNYTPPKKKRK